MINDLIVIGINKDIFESISDEILKKVNRQNGLKNVFILWSSNSHDKKAGYLWLFYAT